MAILNIWEKTTFFCMNHKEPKKMEIIQNTEKFMDPFYACDNYISIPASKRQADAGYCSNRLGAQDAASIMEAFLERAGKAGPVADLTNDKFNFVSKGRRKYEIKVLKYTEKEIWLGVLNKSVLMS